MAGQTLSRRDLDFLLHEWLNLDALLRRPRFAEHSRETVEALLNLAGKIAHDHFLTHYKKADREEPTLAADGVKALPEIRAALRVYAEAGFSAAPFDSSAGGLQLPHLVCTAAMAHFMAANVATAAYPMLTQANARLLLAFGSQAQIDAFAIPEIAGRALGTMCLSEPQAGSSLGDIATRALPDGNDGLGARHRLFGNKMWISGGDHDLSDNIVHLVLAKFPGADGKLVPGSKGLSLFVVPKVLPDGTRNDIAVAGLNHKMGYRGTTNCLLNFGEGTAHKPEGKPGAVGWRVGEPGNGLAVMFHMMNEARIAIGLGAAMLGYRGYLEALEYARQRRQGRKLGEKNPAGPQIALIDHPDVKRMLLAQKAYAEGALALVLYCAALVDEQHTAPDKAARDEAETLLGLLTPVAKTWPSEWGLAANDLAIQIHGGYGYTRDFDVEQLYRDNRLNPIHEGTTGIQAIDLLGRKILRDGGKALALLGQRVDATAATAAKHADLAPHAAALSTAWRQVSDEAAGLVAHNDADRALWNATSFLSAFGHVVMAWLWLDQAIVAAQGRGEENFYRGKRQACRYFFEIELPKIGAWLKPVRAMTDVAAAMPDEAF